MKRITLTTLFLVSFVALLFSQSLDGVRIYINPGHGGYDSDDRNIVIPPFSQGDPEGFWESKSNLHKGLMLKDMLDELNATTFISRTQNRTEDDLPLSQIVRSANESNADFMISIHSNAGNSVANYVLMLYAGLDVGDTHSYPTPTPHSETGRVISTIIAQNLYGNECNSWSANYTVRGDKTFGRTAMGWSDGYGVLRGLTVPGVISEGSMHDYIPETYRLMNMDYKWMEAWHFVKSFLTHFKSESFSTGNIAGTLRDKHMLNEAGYYKLPNSLDTYLAVNGATVTLEPGGLTYEVDNMNNGFFMFKNLNPGSYTLTVDHPDYHPVTSSVEVNAGKISYVNLRPNMVRSTPPAVLEYGPQAEDENTPVLTSSVIHFRFNWDIDTESAEEAFSIEPAVEGRFVFKESNFVMEFVPDAPLDVSTLYTVKLSTALRHHDGLNMEEEFEFTFFTADRNQLKLLASYPQAGAENIHFKTPTFTFIFDKKLVTSELISGLQVFDMEGNQLVKNVRSLKHNAYPDPLGSTAFTMGQDLIPGEEYVVKIAKGIKDIDGVFLTDTLEIPFRASDERRADKPVVLDFEANGLMVADKDAGTQVATQSVARNSSTKLFGTYTYNLKYKFEDFSGGEAIYLFENSEMVIAGDSVAGLHIFGDMTGNELYLILASENEKVEVKLDELNFGGWRYAEAKLDLPEGETFKIEGVKIVQQDALYSQTGNIFIDNLLLYAELINAVEKQQADKLHIYPNPADVTVFVAHPQGLPLDEIQLIGVDGKLILSVKGDRLDVSQVPEGSYILRAKTGKGFTSSLLFVKH